MTVFCHYLNFTLDVIDDKTLQYYNGNGIYFQIGGFTWSGHFTWIDIPEREKARTNYNPVAPVRTPTMAGGLFLLKSLCNCLLKSL